MASMRLVASLCPPASHPQCGAPCPTIALRQKIIGLQAPCRAPNPSSRATPTPSPSPSQSP
eukprot:14009735-Alexandrium_andersonii.AAC.1